MLSIGLSIPSTRFPLMEPKWEFTALSHEPGAICTWEPGESGWGAIAIAFYQPTNTHPHACWVHMHALGYIRAPEARSGVKP
jgi:hypothetical protein